jgi:hypothetical protein
VLLHLAMTLTLLYACLQDEFVYLLPNGRVQWNPNVTATKIPLSSLSEERQRALLEQRANRPTMQERLRAHAAKFSPVFASAPATRVRVLLACDTNAEGGIAAGVEVDRRRMTAFFRDAFQGRTESCEITDCSGAGLSVDAVLKHYRNLDSTASETLVCYYSGHGGVSPLGHALTFSDGTILYRTQLLAAMNKRPHQSLILLTDCCANTTAFDEQEYKERRERLKGVLQDELPWEIPTDFDPRTVEWLFLRHTGTIDLNAASPTRDQFSWSTDRTGGFFTYSLVRVLRSDVNRINQHQRARVDNQVDWKMAFNIAQAGAAYLSLGRQDAPPVETLMRIPPHDRDRVWQFPCAFSFH